MNKTSMLKTLSHNAFGLVQSLTVSIQFCISNFTHKSCINSWYGFSGTFQWCHMLGSPLQANNIRKLPWWNLNHVYPHTHFVNLLTSYRIFKIMFLVDSLGLPWWICLDFCIYCFVLTFYFAKSLSFLLC